MAIGVTSACGKGTLETGDNIEIEEGLEK